MSLVSVIIPTYNRPALLAEAVHSAALNGYRNLEIIIVDDGSTDSTPEACSALHRQYGSMIRYIHQENAGAGAARQNGLQHASGDYIQYLDSDDLLLAGKFSAQVAALNSSPQAGVCYGVTLRVNSNSGQQQPWARTADDITNIFPSFLMKRGWDTNCPLWRRETCEAIGPWGPFRVFEDWEHDLRAGILGVVPCRVNQPVASVRDHNQQRASGMNSGLTRNIVEGMFLTHESIWSKMRSAQLTDWSYLQEFSRKMFWIARLCGDHGMISNAEQALHYTDEMTQVNSRPSCTRLFRAVRRSFGWRMASWMVESTRKMRS